VVVRGSSHPPTTTGLPVAEEGFPMSSLTLPTRTGRSGVGVASADRRLLVPWSIVLPIAVVLAYADGFWVTSLRGAVGAIERAQHPFGSWLLQSTLMVPLFTLAVLGALTLSCRMFGPTQRTVRARVASGLLIVAAGTAVALAELSANAAYDYHLQGGQAQFMDNMAGGHCNAACVASTNASDLTVQLRGLALGGRLLIVTNLVLVAWLIALRGGRLRAARIAGGEQPATRTDTLRLLLAAALGGTAVVHGTAASESFADWPVATVFFLLLSGAGVVVAARLLLRPTAIDLYAAVALAVGPLALWAESRTIGLPFGPRAGRAMGIGLTDSAAVVLEVGILLIAGLLFRARSQGARPASRLSHVRWLGVFAVVSATVIGVAGSVQL
jgi:hypothetical protein